MPVESAADLASFFNDDEFAVVATYQPRYGDAVEITGIFDAPHEAVDAGGEVAVSSFGPQLRVQTAALPCDIAAGDVVTIGEDDFKVADFQPDGTGTTIIDLHKA